MKRIYGWDAKSCLRNYTAADLLALKGVRKLTQTTANSEEEAAAAADAGIDLIMGNAVNAEAVRCGAPNHFYTAAIPMPDHPTEKDVLEAAFLAMKRGADSVYTARGPHVVELLAREQIPVMCHLGFVPRRSTWNGGLRAIGKTAEEAIALWQNFRDMENAGAFSVEAEVICDRVMAEISKRTTLITSSLGSGAWFCSKLRDIPSCYASIERGGRPTGSYYYPTLMLSGFCVTASRLQFNWKLGAVW